MGGHRHILTGCEHLVHIHHQYSRQQIPNPRFANNAFVKTTNEPHIFFADKLRLAALVSAFQIIFSVRLLSRSRDTLWDSRSTRNFADTNGHKSLNTYPWNELFHHLFLRIKFFFDLFNDFFCFFF